MISLELGKGILFYVKLITNWPCHDSKFACDVQYSYRVELAAGKGKKRSVRRRVSSGNVVPAVGKGEGATPRRIQSFSYNISKN